VDQPRLGGDREALYRSSRVNMPRRIAPVRSQALKNVFLAVGFRFARQERIERTTRGRQDENIRIKITARGGLANLQESRLPLIRWILCLDAEGSGSSG